MAADEPRVTVTTTAARPDVPAADGEPDRADPADGADDAGRSGRQGRLGLHLGLYVLLLAGLLALTPTLEPWSSDDGVYAQATRVLDGGRWSEDRPDQGLDEDPTRYALALAEVDAAGRAHPYLKHPAWIAVQEVSTSLTGRRVGFVLPNLVGCVLGAVAAWAAARRLRAGHPAVAFWLVGLGPLAVTSTSLWSHALAAGLGGVATVLLIDLFGRRSPVRAVGLGLALVGVLAVRTEGLLLAPAVVVALALLRPGRWSDLRRLVDPGLVALVVVAGAVAERAWIAAIAVDPVATGPSPSPSDGFVMGRTLAAWRTFTLGANGDVPGELLTMLVLACTVVAVVLIARGVPLPGPAVLLAVAVVAGVVRWSDHAHGQDSYISGIAPAWPVMAAGAYLWLRSWREAPVAERAIAVAVALSTGALLLVQYEGGAGTDWGGRYLAPVTVPLAVLAAAGLARTARTAPVAAPRRLLPTVVAVGLVLTAFGTFVTLTGRSDVAATVDQARASDAQVVVALFEFVPRTDFSADTTTFWRRPGRDGPVAAVERAFAEGYRRVGVLGAEPGLVVPGATRRVVADGALVVFTR